MSNIVTNRKVAQAAGASTYVGRPCSRGHIERSTEHRYCMQCRRDKASRERAANPELVRERTRQWRAVSREARVAYRKDRLAYYAERANSRRAGLRTATPAWSESLCILSLYKIAERLRVAGADVQVDHVVPIKGKIVSGLHVRNNLRIIPSIENQRKNRHFIEASA